MTKRFGVTLKVLNRVLGVLWLWYEVEVNDTGTMAGRATVHNRPIGRIRAGFQGPETK